MSSTASFNARILPLVIASALFMEQMDSTIIATSLPAIAGDLGVSPVALKLAFTTYLLGLTVVLPVRLLTRESRLLIARCSSATSLVSSCGVLDCLLMLCTPVA